MKVDLVTKPDVRLTLSWDEATELMKGLGNMTCNQWSIHTGQHTEQCLILGTRVSKSLYMVLRDVLLKEQP